MAPAEREEIAEQRGGSDNPPGIDIVDFGAVHHAHTGIAGPAGATNEVIHSIAIDIAHRNGHALRMPGAKRQKSRDLLLRYTAEHAHRGYQPRILTDRVGGVFGHHVEDAHHAQVFVGGGMAVVDSGPDEPELDANDDFAKHAIDRGRYIHHVLQAAADKRFGRGSRAACHVRREHGARATHAQRHPVDRHGLETTRVDMERMDVFVGIDQSPLFHGVQARLNQRHVRVGLAVDGEHGNYGAIHWPPVERDHAFLRHRFIGKVCEQIGGRAQRIGPRGDDEGRAGRIAHHDGADDIRNPYNAQRPLIETVIVRQQRQFEDGAGGGAGWHLNQERGASAPAQGHSGHLLRFGQRVAVLRHDEERQGFATALWPDDQRHEGTVADVGHVPDLRLARKDADDRVELAVNGVLAADGRS